MIDLGYWPIVGLLALILVILLWALIAEDYGDSFYDEEQEEEE